MTNLVVIEGRVTQNAILKTAGTSIITTFSIANDQSYKKNGEWVNNAYFFECEIWGEYGNSVREYLSKGQRLTVTGQLVQNRWQDSDGKNRSLIKIRVKDLSIQFEKKQTNQQHNSGPSFQEIPPVEDHSLDFPPAEEGNPF